MLPHFSCHILRHTFATRLMESGVSLKYLSGTLGHSEIQTTMDIYVSKTDEFSQHENKTFDYRRVDFTNYYPSGRISRIVSLSYNAYTDKAEYNDSRYEDIDDE